LAQTRFVDLQQDERLSRHRHHRRRHVEQGPLITVGVVAVVVVVVGPPAGQTRETVGSVATEK